MTLLYMDTNETTVAIVMIPGTIFIIYIFYRIWKSGTTFKVPGQSWDAAKSTNRLLNESVARELSKEDPELVKKAIENLKSGGYPVNPLSIKKELNQIKTFEKLKETKNKIINVFTGASSKQASMNDKLSTLDRLFELKEKGAITEEEFQREKSRLI